MRDKIRFCLSVVLVFTMLVIPYFPASAAPDTGNTVQDTENMDTASRTSTVRVGYYKGDSSFQDGFSDEERKSGYAYEYYQEIALLAGWDYEYVYGTREEIFDKLFSGEVDIAAGIYKTDKRKDQVLFSKYDMGMDGEKRYFAVNIDRPDLLEKLNSAQDKLLASKPYFTMALRQKYYVQNTYQQILTDAETDWLTKKGSLNMGYVRYNLPLSDQLEDGTPTGIAGELFSMIAANLKVDINPVCYENVELMEQGLRNGEIDAAFPIYSDLWVTESKGFYQTDPFISERVMLVYEGSYRNDLMNKIALSKNGLGQKNYLAAYYPNSQAVLYETKEEAFEAIHKGEVSCMAGCSSIIQRFLATHSEYKNVNIAYLDTSENFGIAVNQKESQLAVILNKAVSQLDEAIIANALIRYSNVEAAVSFMDFVRRYAIAVIAVLSMFFAALLWLYVKFRFKTRLFNEEQAKTRQALEAAVVAANAASVSKTTFLSSMSHDIRTPMNGIIGMTAIAKANIKDTAKVKDCLDKITISSKHLLALINEVLDMSKIESGSIHLNEEIFDFSELMDNLITLNKSLADARYHEMKVHISNLTHEKVIGDSIRIQQIFTNLVSNAIKYTPDGGKIEIKLSELPSRDSKAGRFEFSVRDNGIGMSEEYLPHVFDAFTREENTSSKTKTKTPIQGTGLGMTIARNIARMMDGDITVESSEGKGSKFTVTLSLKLPETENVHYEEFSGLKVLIIDDDEIACESAALLLSDMGIESEWFLSGHEAIESLKEKEAGAGEYFAVLLDWNMPDKSGLETAKEIREYIGNDTSVIIVSDCDWTDIEEEALNAGVNGFIGKPLFKSRLVHLFKRLLGDETDEKESGIEELTGKADFEGKRALMAEDNELNAEITMEILGMTGLLVEWVHNGREAVRKMLEMPPGYYDCIFMDVQMPVMNGIEAAKAIRSNPRQDLKEIPIFAMTANAFAEDVQAVMNAGMNEHIGKPIDISLLIDVLCKYIK